LQAVGVAEEHSAAVVVLAVFFMQPIFRLLPELH
jgi:hypothetical protein